MHGRVVFGVRYPEDFINIKLDFISVYAPNFENPTSALGKVYSGVCGFFSSAVCIGCINVSSYNFETPMLLSIN